MAPTISGARRCREPGTRDGALMEPRRRSQEGIFGTAREADVELLQLAVEMRALEAGLLGDLAHVALLAAEELLEVQPLERLARLAQGQLEEARGDLGRDRRRRRRGFAEEALHVLR